jgi:hypothetical protein
LIWRQDEIFEGLGIKGVQDIGINGINFEKISWEQTIFGRFACQMAASGVEAGSCPQDFLLAHEGDSG